MYKNLSMAQIDYRKASFHPTYIAYLNIYRTHPKICSNCSDFIISFIYFTVFYSCYIHFNTHTHQQGESVATFIAELQHLAWYCDFGDSLKDMLHDRLVCGIENGRIQYQLLAEPLSIPDKTIKILPIYEICRSQCKRPAKSQHPQAINVIKNQSPSTVAA